MENERYLYSDPDLYSRVFPIEEEEVGFFASFLRESAAEGTVLDLGCGTGELVRRLKAKEIDNTFGVDRERTMLAAGVGVCGCLTSLPFRPGSLAAVICRLFGVAYAMGSDWETSGGDFIKPLLEIFRVLDNRGTGVLEIPLAHSPSRLVGLEENTRVDGDFVYKFRYLDILRQTELGAILDTRIEVGWGDFQSIIHAPLHVFIPGNLRSWLPAMGFEITGFFASYERESRTMEPPPDCLRGVVVFQRCECLIDGG